MATNEWLTGTHSGLISIDGHNLFLSTTGPDRVPGTPVVILESGLGGSSSSWPLVIRHLSPFVRVYIHDRAGLGKSEVDPLANNNKPEVYAEKAAEQLDKLLQKAGVEGPFILVPMSWGGIVAREFLERRKEDIVGMVMLECVQERTNEVIPIDAPNTMALLKGLDFFEVVGVYKRQRLTPEEWQVSDTCPSLEAVIIRNVDPNARDSRKRTTDGRRTLRMAAHRTDTWKEKAI
jgi:pimeloyl-ACP methyl ester carboxylesterase